MKKIFCMIFWALSPCVIAMPGGPGHTPREVDRYFGGLGQHQERLIALWRERDAMPVDLVDMYRAGKVLAAWFQDSDEYLEFLKGMYNILNQRFGRCVQGLTQIYYPLARVPADPPERIAVIGGGYTGILTALLLAGLRGVDARPLYSVHLFERGPHLLTGASMAPGRLHLGGEYPEDLPTALECLDGATLFRQMLGGVYTDIQSVVYLLSRRSPPSLTMEKMQVHWRTLQERYCAYFGALEKVYGDATEKVFCGRPEDLWRPVDVEKMGLSDGFVGGLLTHEKGLHPVRMGVLLESLLEARGVKVSTGRAAQINPWRGEVDGEGLPGYIVNQQHFHQVINATWPRFLSVEGLIIDLAHRKDNPTAYIYRRAILLADTRQCALPQVDGEKVALFGLGGEGGGMFSPFNDQVGLFYWPHRWGSYVGDYAVNPKEHPTAASKPEEMQTLEGEEKSMRISAMVHDMRQKYKLQDAGAFDLIVQETVTDTHRLQERSHKKALNIPFEYGKVRLRDYVRALSYKATYAPMTSLEAVYCVLENSRDHERNSFLATPEGEWLAKFYRRKGESLPGPVLPEIFRLPPLEEPQFHAGARAYCELRGFADGFGGGTQRAMKKGKRFLAENYARN